MLAIELYEGNGDFDASLDAISAALSSADSLSSNAWGNRGHPPAMDPKYTDARFNLASVEAEGGDLASSVKGFKQILAERPDYPKAQERVGDVLFAWGISSRNPAIISRLSNGTRMRSRTVPKDVALLTSLRVALARLGRIDEARTQLETALRIDPNFEPAQRLLVAIPQ